MMQLFAKIVNRFYVLTIFAKWAIVDIQQGPKYEF